MHDGGERLKNAYRIEPKSFSEIKVVIFHPRSSLCDTLVRSIVIAVQLLLYHL
jgi:hypothetical protein